IHTYASEANKVFGNATVLTVRAGGLWELNLVTGPLTGDLVTPSRTDNFTGYVCCGATSSGRTVVRRDTQAVKLERYVARSGTTHTLRRSEEHTSELQSRSDLVCRLLLEKKKKKENLGVLWEERRA